MNTGQKGNGPTDLEGLLGIHGLSERHARLYLLAARNGPVTASELARLAGIHRVVAYRDARELLTRGLLTVQGSPQRFAALPLKQVLDRLEQNHREQLEHLRRSRQRIERLWEEEESRPWEHVESLRFRYFEGKAAVDEAFQRYVGLCRRTIDSVIPPTPGWARDAAPRFAAVAESLTRGVKFRSVIRLTRDNIEPAQRLTAMGECRVVQDLQSFRYLIMDGRGILMILTEDPRLPPTGLNAAVWTTAPEAVRFYRTHFDALFARGVPIQRRLTTLHEVPTVTPVMTPASSRMIIDSLEGAAERWLRLFAVDKVRMDFSGCLQCLGQEVGHALGKELPRGGLAAAVRALDQRFAREALGRVSLKVGIGRTVVRWERCGCCIEGFQGFGKEVCPAILRSALSTAVGGAMEFRTLPTVGSNGRQVHVLEVVPRTERSVRMAVAIHPAAENAVTHA